MQMMGASCDTNLKSVFDGKSTFDDAIGENVLLTSGPEGVCVLLEGILNSMNNTTEQRISVETIENQNLARPLNSATLEF